MSKSKNNPVTHVAIVLDKSGSMNRTKTAAITGYNEQIQQLKANAKDGQEILVSLVTFTGNVYEHLWEVPVDQLQEASAESYVPDGATAMRDAVGYTVQKLLDTTDSKKENTAYLVIVISDGETNSDKFFKAKMINESGKMIEVNPLKELVESCQKTNKWTFTYMGCSEEYLKTIAEETAIPIANMAAWSNATEGQTYGGIKMASCRSASYFKDRSEGLTSKLNYMDESGVACMDFTQCCAAPADVPPPVTTTTTSAATFANSTNADWQKYAPRK